MNLKNTNIKLDSVQLATLMRNPGIIFVVLLVALFAFEVLVIKNSVSLVTSSIDQKPIGTAHTGGESINFKDYDLAVKRIQDAQNFEPINEPAINPFYNNSTNGQ